MTSMHDDTNKIICSMKYIMDNDIPLPRPVEAIFTATSISVMLAKLGAMDKIEVITAAKDAWGEVDSFLVHAMGYDLRTNWDLSNRMDNIGEYVTEYFSRSKRQEAKDLVENADFEAIRGLVGNDVTRVDLDTILWDIIAPWFLDEMVTQHAM